MISMKDYATAKNVSYEAVRKQVNRYRAELEGHISKVNRTQFLDDEAVAFLDTKRQENPVIVMETNKDDEIQRLCDENKALLLKLTEVQDKLVKSQETIVALQNEKMQLQQEKIVLLSDKSEARSEEEGTPVERKHWLRSLFKKDL